MANRLPGEELPDHVKGVRVKIRRARLLEDGYVKGAGRPPVVRAGRDGE